MVRGEVGEYQGTMEAAEMVKILNSERSDGKRSRSVTTAQVIAMVGALQAGLSTYFNTALPAEWHWLYGVAMIALSIWLGYLRHDTSQPMA